MKKLFLGILLIGLNWNSLSFAQALSNCRVTSQTTFGATSLWLQGLAQKSNRRCLVVQNVSRTSTIYLQFGSGSTTFNGLTLTAGTMWAPYIVPMNAIFVSADSAVGTSTLFIQGE